MKSHTIKIEKEEKLILKLTTEDSDISYQIWVDTRQPNIFEIEKFINTELNYVYSGVKPFEVKEYDARDYIYIGEKSEQFSARRV